MDNDEISKDRYKEIFKFIKTEYGYNSWLKHLLENDGSLEKQTNLTRRHKNLVMRLIFKGHFERLNNASKK